MQFLLYAGSATLKGSISITCLRDNCLYTVYSCFVKVVLQKNKSVCRNSKQHHGNGIECRLLLFGSLVFQRDGLRNDNEYS